MGSVIPARLGTRINLSLLLFILVLGTATAALVFWGFHRSQDDASQRSREGLESQGLDTLRSFAEMQSYIGQLQFAPASEFAQQAAAYMYNLKVSGATVPWHPATLQRGVAGTLYDPNPARKTNVFVQPWATLDDSLARDLRDSAALDAAFPTLFADYPGRLLEANFRPIAAFYVSPAGGARYYPPLFEVNDTVVSSRADFDAFMDKLGPAGNPERRTIWTQPYQDESGRGLVITAYVPTYEGVTFRGVIGVDLSMDRLTQQVNDVKPSASGFAFYVDRNGELMHSNAYDTLTGALSGGRNPALTSAFEAMKAGQSGVTRVDLDGREFFVAFTPFLSVGGTFALAAPVDELTTQAEGVRQSINDAGNRTVGIMLLTMGVLFVGALGGTAWLNRRVLLQPISELVGATRAVAAGNLDATIPVRSNDELGDLATAFNRMTTQLKQRNSDLRREISERELTAAALSEREEQYRSIFESASDAIFITDMDDRNVDANPAACAMHGYALEELRAKEPFANVKSGPNQRNDYLETLRAGRDYHGRVTKVRKDGSEFLAEVHATPFNYQGAPHILLITRDITEQAEHEQVLERRVEERTRELATLLDLTKTVASTLDLSALLALILDQIQEVVPYTGASILVLEGDQLVVKDARGPLARDPGLTAIEQRFPINGFDHILKAWDRGEVVVVDDVRGPGAGAEDFRKAAGPLLDTTFARVVAWLGVPMMRQGRLTGMLALSRPESGAFSRHEADLALALANQAAIAIENARLYSEAERRASEMSALSYVASSVNLQRSLQDTVDTVAHRVVETTRAIACSVSIIEDGKRSDAAGSYGLSPEFVGLINQLLAAGGRSPNLQVYETGKPRVIRNVRAGTLATPGFELLADEIRKVEWDTMVIIPMAFGGQIVGTFEAFYRPEDDPDDRELELIAAMTRQAATAIENARLFAQTGRRVRQLEALGEIASSFTFEQSMEAMLDNLAGQVVHASTALACTVTVIDEDEDFRLRMLGTAGMPAGFAAAMEHAYALGAPSTTMRNMTENKIQTTPRGRSIALADERYAEARALVRDAKWDTLLAVPIVYRDRPLGMLVACYDPARDPDAEEVQFIEAIGDQAAIAIENARLFNQASAVAALEERQRLARELHDSVSQALYGIALGARTARRRLGDDAPTNIAEPLDYVLTLAEAGLTEMRALIFSLRPESLESEGLVAAITRQAAVMQARYGVTTTVQLPKDEPSVPLPVKEAVYRIAQESLHNTVKHARASSVSVRLSADGNVLDLEVRDDGQGFDPDGDFPGHLGLRAMRERAAGAGGTLDVESSPGNGTRVHLLVPLKTAGAR